MLLIKNGSYNVFLIVASFYAEMSKTLRELVTRAGREINSSKKYTLYKGMDLSLSFSSFLFLICGDANSLL